MLDLDYKLNMKLMQELGLEEGERRRVIDQDTGEICALGSKEIVTPGSQGGKNAIEFNPISNPKMMNKLFGEFVDKLYDEGSIESSCVSYGTYYDKYNNKNTARAIFDDGSVITSAPYKNESLCLIDITLQINGENDINLKEYDELDRRKAATMKAPKPTMKKRLKGDNNGNVGAGKG